MKKITQRSPKEVIDLWIKALESGEYKQGTGSLRIGDTFCCLGVLCDLAAKDGGAKWKDNLTIEGYSYRGHRGFLSPKISRYLGLTRSQHDSLTAMNDNGHYNFKGIAKTIRKWFPA